jgi:hypothetical protein
VQYFVVHWELDISRLLWVLEIRLNPTALSFHTMKAKCYLRHSSYCTTSIILLRHHDDDCVYGMRPAATSGPIVHPSGDIWAWRTTVEWYRQGKTPDSSIGALCQSYQQSSTSKEGWTGRWNDEFCDNIYFNSLYATLYIKTYMFWRTLRVSDTFQPSSGVIYLLFMTPYILNCCAKRSCYTQPFNMYGVINSK